MFSDSSVAWGDYDNDGDLDMLMSGSTRLSDVSRLYRNNTSMNAGVFPPIPNPSLPSHLHISQPDGTDYLVSVRTDETILRHYLIMSKWALSGGDDILPHTQTRYPVIVALRTWEMHRKTPLTSSGTCHRAPIFGAYRRWTSHIPEVHGLRKVIRSKKCAGFLYSRRSLPWAAHPFYGSVCGHRWHCLMVLWYFRDGATSTVSIPFIPFRPVARTM